jgi:hypothetical protein
MYYLCLCGRLVALVPLRMLTGAKMLFSTTAAAAGQQKVLACLRRQRQRTQYNAAFPPFLHFSSSITLFFFLF